MTQAGVCCLVWKARVQPVGNALERRLRGTESLRTMRGLTKTIIVGLMYPLLLGFDTYSKSGS
jgi:hypothetical protein